MAYIQIPAFSKTNTLDNDTEFVIVVDEVEHLVTFKTLSDKFGNTPELLASIEAEITALRSIVDALPTENPAAPIALKIADTPTIDGIYKPTETGVYPNAGSLEYDPTEGITYFIRTQGVWTKDVTPVNFTPTGVVEENNPDAVSGGEVYRFNKYENFEKGFRKTGNLFEPTTVEEGYYLDLNGDKYPNASFGISDFIPIKELTKYSQNAPQTRNFYDKDFNHIIGYSDSVNTWGSPENTAYVRLNVALGNVAVFVLVEGSNISDDTKSTEATIEGVLNPIVTIISHNDTSYNSIRTLAEKLRLEANYYNRYIIELGEGTYNETDWKGFGEFVKIIGNNRDNCVIYFDGNSDKILPLDYSFNSFSGQIANTVEKGAKHIVFLMRDCYCENLTFFAENCKYTIHADNNGFEKAYFKNCWIKESECNYPIGIGTWGGQYLKFENSVLERPHFYTKRHGFIYHNTYNQSKNTLTEFLNCKFIQCGGALVNENGSNRNDVLNIFNCESDSIFEIEYGVSQDADGKTFWTNPVTGVKVADPRDIPYNIKLNTLGTNVELIEDSRNFVGYDSSRPLFYKHVISDYIGVTKVYDSVEAGDLLSNIGDASHSTANRSSKFISDVLSLPPIGVALHDGSNEEMVYFSKIGKISKVKFTGGGISDYNGNTRKLYYSEADNSFKSNPLLSNKDIDALAYENDNANGLLLAKTYKK